MAKGNLSSTWSADFETTGKTNLEIDGRVRVWLWSLVRCSSVKEEYYGTTIESFFEKITQLNVEKIWFHNLRFDGSFIVWHLLYETP